MFPFTMKGAIEVLTKKISLAKQVSQKSYGNSETSTIERELEGKGISRGVEVPVRKRSLDCFRGCKAPLKGDW